MKEIYDVTDKVRKKIQTNGITNVVTFGDILDVDLDKTTIFPLSHIVLGSVTFGNHSVTIPLTVLFLDIVDVNKSLTDDDIFYGNSNLQDVLNTQFTAANLLQSQLRRGDLFEELFQIDGNVTADPFLDNFENQLAGWSLTVNIEIPNKEIDIC